MGSIKDNIREYPAVFLDRDCEYLTIMNQKGTLHSAKSNLLFIKVVAVFNWYVDTIAAVCCLQPDLLYRLVRSIRRRGRFKRTIVLFGSLAETDRSMKLRTTSCLRPYMMQMAVRMSTRGQSRDAGVYQESSQGLPCIEGRLDCRGAVAGAIGACGGIGMIDKPSYPSCSFPMLLNLRVN
jgi:hypothetical protein